MNKIKDQKSKTKNTNRRLKNHLLLLAIFFLGFFLFINIFISQRISPLYFRIINNNRQATINFLKKTKTLPEFNFYLATNINIFGHFLENEVFSDQRVKEEKVAHLKSLLSKNPRSRDILYNLYLLNTDLGNFQEAKTYFKLAKEIDPEIK